MSKEITVRKQVCPNCDVKYDTREEAEACIKDHKFPKKLWLDMIALERETIDGFLKRIATEVLDFTRVTWRSDAGCPVERFTDAFEMDFLIEVDMEGHVTILEIHPLQGLGFSEFYKLIVTKETK